MKLNDTLEFMLDSEVEADLFFSRMLDFCENEKELKVLTRTRDRVLNVKFYTDWSSVDVTVHVLAEQKMAVFCAELPILCRPGNVDKLKVYLHDLNCGPVCGTGHFVLDEKKHVCYVTTYVYKGSEAFNKEAFEHYLDDAVIISSVKAKGILRVATEFAELDDDNPDDALRNWDLDDLLKDIELDDIPEIPDDEIPPYGRRHPRRPLIKDWL